MDIKLHRASVQRGRTWALREISWRLRPGERWALIGENGAGKTQLLKLLSGVVWPTPSGVDDRHVERIYRRGRRRVDPTVAMSRIAYIGGESQDKYTRYGWNLPVRDVVATGLHRSDLLLQGVTAAETRRVAGMLSACRLERLAERRFLSLSYGEKRLTLLARALVQEPDWLLLDEFYNGIDAAYRRRIDAILSRARRRGQGWVVTAHRAADIPAGTDMLLELAAGRILYSGALQRAALRRLTPADAPGRTVRTPRPAAGRALLSMRNVDLYIEHHSVLKHVDWQVRRGQHWAVVGANGSGKSSFLKLLYGDLAPAFGGVLTRAGCPRGSPISEWKRRTGLVSPELQTTYLIDVPLIELVASGRHSSIGLNQPMTGVDERSARRWLEFFELAEHALDRPRELSYGQLRRALVARAMSAGPTLVLLDEPLTGLDAKQRGVMKRLLSRLMRESVTLVAAVHHRDDLPDGITHELRLHKRRAIAHKLQSAI